MIAAKRTSSEFMVNDLARSGLTPKDLIVSPVEANDFVPCPRYRIHYPLPSVGSVSVEYYRDRFDREKDKYVGPPGVTGIWTRSVEALTEWAGAKIKLVVEGEKKAASAVKYLHLPAIGIGGCWGFMANEAPIKELFEMIRPDDLVHLVLDGDIETKPNIGMAGRRFAKLVAERGASIKIVALGKDSTGRRLGLDDWIVANLDARSKVRDLYNKLPAIDPQELPEAKEDVARRLDLDTTLKTTQAGVTYLEIDKSARNCQILVEDRFRTLLRNDRYLGWRFRGRPFQDPRDDMEIRIAMEQVVKGGFPKEMLVDARRSLLQTNEHCELAEWLSSLKWDGKPRVESLFTEYCDPGSDQPKEYLQAAARVLFTGLVLRALRPGVKFDRMIVLVGPQGIGKTTLWEAISSAQYLRTAIFSTQRLTDLARITEKAWILNFDEMQISRRDDLTEFKNWITHTEDSWVPKYQEAPKERPRSFIAVGTTNREAFLSDTTGNRRFIPIDLRAINVAKVKEDREQLLAEAVHLANNAEGAWWEVPFEEVHQEEHRSVNPFEDQIKEHLAQAAKLKDGRVFVTYHSISQVLQLQKGDLTREYYDSLKVVEVLRMLKWKKVKVKPENVDLDSVGKDVFGSPNLAQFFLKIGGKFPSIANAYTPEGEDFALRSPGTRGSRRRGGG